MKTARTRAAEWLEKNGYMATQNTVEELVLLLNEQDRNTRHACAEAIPPSLFDSEIEYNLARAKIMNSGQYDMICHWCENKIPAGAVSTDLFVLFGYYFCCEKCAKEFQTYVMENK